jgi:hypothetical protein
MLLADYKEFAVPRVYADLSTKRVLTTAFVRGIPLDKVMNLDVSQEIRNWVLIFSENSRKTRKIRNAKTSSLF